MPAVLFYIFAVAAVGTALMVISSRNAVYSALYLIGTLFSLACIFLLLHAEFIAAIQVLVYAGAIMVLFLFVIMLLNLGHDYQRDIRGGVGIVLGFAVAGGLGGLLARQISGGTPGLQTALGAGDAIDAALLEHGAVGAIARPLFTDYLVPFELTGILLLVAIVGAIVLAKKGV